MRNRKAAKLIHFTGLLCFEQLMISSIRQHELTEAAENLNKQLRGEITDRQQAEKMLRATELSYRRYSKRRRTAS
jgi:hypothetical protein